MVLTRDLNGLMVRHRKDGDDAYTVFRIIANNMYGLPESLTGETVIDIGAHVGAFSLLAAQRGARVLAFEPEHDNYGLLLENIEANSGLHGSIAPHCLAISEHGGRQRLYIHTDNLGCHSLKLGLNGFTPESAFQEVNSVPVDWIFQQYVIEHCAFLKLDCEGGEEYVLPALWSGGLMTRVQRLGVEFHTKEFQATATRQLLTQFKLAPRSKYRSEWEQQFER